MAFLLDTHAFLWFVAGDAQLPSDVKNIIKDANNPCFISTASLWEITIKKQLGKLTLKLSLDELFKYALGNQIEIIPITFDHLLALSSLPFHHRDPFDRLIVSQAISENLVLISRDKEFKKYKVKQKWN